VATRLAARLSPTGAGFEAAVAAAYALAALMLAGEAAVHIDQFASSYYAVRWIGPLFVANAVACLVVIAGLAYPRTRPLAALAGVAVSALALGGLAVSYGQGLFGWQEFGFDTPIALAVITELGAVIAASTALALSATVRTTHSGSRRPNHRWSRSTPEASHGAGDQPAGRDR
jgi:hypothetical protein